jgi:hypothetical protein
MHPLADGVCSKSRVVEERQGRLVRQIRHGNRMSQLFRYGIDQHACSCEASIQLRSFNSIDHSHILL